MEMMSKVSAFAGFLGVALGAFGAHGLKEVLMRNGTGEVWQTAVLYHLIHAVMLVITASRNPLPVVSWWLFMTGITIFSGSLYILAVTGVKWLGAITPLGGLCLLAGWVMLAFRK